MQSGTIFQHLPEKKRIAGISSSFFLKNFLNHIIISNIRFDFCLRENKGFSYRSLHAGAGSGKLFKEISFCSARISEISGRKFPVRFPAAYGSDGKFPKQKTDRTLLYHNQKNRESTGTCRFSAWIWQMFGNKKTIVTEGTGREKPLHSAPVFCPDVS
ncbi:MAG: hypothetical protein R2941_22330 [Desulfobacterales bacterium]